MSNNEVLIRPMLPADLEGVLAVHQQAFDGNAEARLVASLHEHCESLISLVAERNAAAVGHILFSPAEVVPAVSARLCGLAPMAVLPKLQRTGIGSELIAHGLAACREQHFDAVVVLGHKHYYPHFGFRPAHEFGLRCTYDVPADVFMAQELRAGALHGVAGTVHYQPLFNEL